MMPKIASRVRISYVLHVLQKKSKSGIATPKQDIELVEKGSKLLESIIRPIMNNDRDQKIEDLENTVTPGSGNVYADLGYENSEEMLLKAHLVMLLNKAIKAKGLNQYQAAEILGIDQPKVSALVRGQFRGYSLERLFKFLNTVDLNVEVIVKSKPEEKERAETTMAVP